MSRWSGTYRPRRLVVPALDRVEGVLDRDGDAADDHAVDGVALDLGPEEWIVTAGGVGDLDGDGTAAPLARELDALLGRPVTVLGTLDPDGDEIDVYLLNGVAYRDAAGAPAPWQLRYAPVGAVSSRDDVGAAAISAVPGGARLDEVDQVDDAGDVAWDVEVVDAAGSEYRVLLTADARVLDVRPN